MVVLDSWLEGLPLGREGLQQENICLRMLGKCFLCANEVTDFKVFVVISYQQVVAACVFKGKVSVGRQSSSLAGQQPHVVSWRKVFRQAQSLMALLPGDQVSHARARFRRHLQGVGYPFVYGANQYFYFHLGGMRLEPAAYFVRSM